MIKSSNQLFENYISQQFPEGDTNGVKEDGFGTSLILLFAGVIFHESAGLNCYGSESIAVCGVLLALTTWPHQNTDGPFQNLSL
ncbi:hypothetical protein Tco_1406586 [Tanacetum coccineum]